MTMWIDLTPAPLRRRGVTLSHDVIFFDLLLLLGFMNQPFETSIVFLCDSIQYSSVPLSFGEGLGVRSWHIRHVWFYSIRSGCWK